MGNAHCCGSGCERPALDAQVLVPIDVTSRKGELQDVWGWGDGGLAEDTDGQPDGNERASPDSPTSGDNLGATLSFALINNADDDLPISPVRKSRPSTSLSFELSDKDFAESKKRILERVEHLIDVSYDILKAEIVLSEFEHMARDAPEEWDEVLSSQLFQRFRRKLLYFTDVGETVCRGLQGWFQAFQDKTGTQSIHGYLNSKDPTQLQYRVRALIPASLKHVLAIANEVELMPSWNSLLLGVPKTIGRRTAHYMVLSYQMSFVGGMYKLDVLNEVRRFSDVQGGFLAEYIESVEEDHPSYSSCPVGFRRPKTRLKNVWIACGPEHTMLIQFGSVNLPFSLPKWLAQKVAGIAGESLVGGLVKNAVKASLPGNVWEESLVADRFGLYARLAQCMEAPASLGRNLDADKGLAADPDLTPFFHRQRIQRMRAGP